MTRAPRPASTLARYAYFAGRASDHTFWVNQIRLLLDAAVHYLFDAIRRWLTYRHIASMPLDTLRVWLVKIGGWVRLQVQGIRIHLARSRPNGSLWRLHADRPHRLVNTSG